MRFLAILSPQPLGWWHPLQRVASNYGLRHVPMIGLLARCEPRALAAKGIQSNWNERGIVAIVVAPCEPSLGVAPGP
jgi:hypothetical protein